MQANGKLRYDPRLKELVVEALQALARLDADRLEELARSCEALNREVKQAGEEEYAALKICVRESAKEMAILAHVLEATRANVNVMNRLRELREGRLEYAATECTRTGEGYGNN
jgi:hypothetical protein